MVASHRQGLTADLETRVAAALIAAGAPADSQALVRPASRSALGDFQANGVMAAASKLAIPSGQLAEAVLAHLELAEAAEEVTIAAPGFLNIRLRNQYICACLERDLPVALTPCAAQDTSWRFVIDLSSPNLAKEMHVGHLRSTVIGAAVAGVLTHLGHQVILQNHVGDWGTQFGMLIAYMEVLDIGTDQALSDLEKLYQAARHKFDTDEHFAERARRTVVELQAGNEAPLARWRQFTEASLQHCQALYERLDVQLKPSDVRGESAYNDMLASVVSALDKAGMLSDSEGAKCVFLDEIRGKNDKVLPLIVQKADGGYLYATTDLAALQYRARTLQADCILYFVDARQSLHFRQITAVAERAGFLRPDMQVRHLPFGMVLDKEGKPLRTRDGGVVKLDKLLDEAERRALSLVRKNNPALSEAEHSQIARLVAVGAIKYADLCKSQTSDYVFDWDMMLSFEGNTGPYLQYAYTRIASIFQRASLSLESPLAPLGHLESDLDRTLALHLVRFGEALDEVGKKYQPHLLCTYLHELASKFSSFYENCLVLKAQNNVRNSRLRLCQLTAQTLGTGLSLLGIKVADRM